MAVGRSHEPVVRDMSKIQRSVLRIFCPRVWLNLPSAPASGSRCVVRLVPSGDSIIHHHRGLAAGRPVGASGHGRGGGRARRARSGSELHVSVSVFGRKSANATGGEV